MVENFSKSTGHASFGRLVFVNGIHIFAMLIADHPVEVTVKKSYEPDVGCVNAMHRWNHKRADLYRK